MRRAYVVGAYLPNGGAAMAYHLGRILELDFGFQSVAVAVGDEHPDEGVRGYDLRMPIVSIDEMERQIACDDVLIVNAGYSRFLFGWRIPGFKIAYVQGFAQFNVLDRRLDHYVAVSDVVARHLAAVYDLDVRVIPPFIDVGEVQSTGMVGAARESRASLPKGIARRLGFVLAPAPRDPCQPSAGDCAGRADPGADAADRAVVPHRRREIPADAVGGGRLWIGAARGDGARHRRRGVRRIRRPPIMRSGDNCMVAPFAQIERVADLLIDIVRDSPRAEAMVERARVTAAAFTYEAFRRAWVDEFSAVLSLAPAATGARR